jgi:predicted ArsR family transcriptional regulator
MHFSDFQAHYDRKKSSEHEYDYYPLRSFYTAHQVANELNCPVEYARNMAKTLDEKQAELKTIYNRYTGRNETTWYIYKSGSESIAKKWIEDKKLVCQELKVLGATDVDIEAVLKSFHTPLKASQKVKSRVSSMLTRERKRKLINNSKRP